MFIFGRSHHSLAVVTPAKYERDLKNLTYNIMNAQNREID